MKTLPLVKALADPSSISDFTEEEWDLLIRQARASGLLACLHTVTGSAQLSAYLPTPVKNQFSAAFTVAQRHREVIRWEVEALNAILASIGVPAIVLKGAAYVMSDLQAANGRIFGDIDIMVPHGAIADVEKALGRAGWAQENRSAYDDRYYRKWMHEIPARKHIDRGTVLDVHHNILPLTARNKPDAQALWHKSRRLQGFSDLYVLSPEDMLLHSSSHLFLNGEYNRGLRDLFDFRQLGDELSKEPDFWAKVYERSVQVDLKQPLVYSVKYANRLLNAQIPELAIPQYAGVTFMDWIFLRGLAPNHSSAQDTLSGLALFFLYVRGHYLRMPFRLLIPHLLYKATMARHQENALREKSQEWQEKFHAFIGK